MTHPTKRYVDEGISCFHRSYEHFKENEAVPDEHGMQPLDEDAVYSIATMGYLANGGDGFSVYKEETVETVVDDEAGIPLSLILRNFFWAISTVNKMMEIADDGGDDEHRADRLMAKMDLPRHSMLSVVKTKADAVSLIDAAEREKKEADGYVEALAITPVLEHRIMTVDEEIDFEAEEWKPMVANFQQIPNFLNLKKLPTKVTVMNLLAAIDEAGGGGASPKDTV